jgi:hypothetical protein
MDCGCGTGENAVGMNGDYLKNAGYIKVIQVHN